MAGQTKYLILLRHGESEWNSKNLFTGWVDAKLNEKGRGEAARAGELLGQFPHKPDVLFTSKLSRAIQTANIALENADLLYLDVHRSWRLNERHYGALQGKNKKEIAEEYGNEKFMTWRRSFDVPPPTLDDNSEFSQVKDRRYGNLPKETIPRTESLKIVIERMLPYWEDVIAPQLLDDKTVLIAAINY